jgi:hypothetical protein
LLWLHRFCVPKSMYVKMKRKVHLKNVEDYAYYEKQTVNDHTHEFSHRESLARTVIELFESSPKKLLNHSI